jgi:hypothetical protein
MIAANDALNKYRWALNPAVAQEPDMDYEPPPPSVRVFSAKSDNSACVSLREVCIVEFLLLDLI